MTLQQLFNANWQWFVVDRNGPGYEDGCVYAGHGNENKVCRCGIGCAFPDLKPEDSPTLTISAVMQGSWLSAPANKAAARKRIAKALANIDLNALQDLQEAHDGSAALAGYDGSNPSKDEFLKLYGERLKHFASRWELEVPAGKAVAA